MSIQKLKYLRLSAAKTVLRKGFDCPSCGSGESRIVDRKYLVTALRRCDGCKLLFRTPATTAAENEAFYQAEYSQGFTTDMPDPAALERLVSSGFRGHEKDYSTYIAVLRSLGAGQRLFDYGCSWGYGSFQLGKAGFEVDSYEISVPRAEYGRCHLGIHFKTPEEAVKGSYDVFFSAHVIEHVPSVSEFIAFGLSVLKPGGLFLAFTPNGSESYRRVDPQGWHKSWGFVHPQLIDEVFVRQALQGRELAVASSPYGNVGWNAANDPSGGELAFAARA